MKKILIGAGCGLLIGAGAVLGVMQIPSVSNALIKGNTNTDYIENTQDKNTIANLENQNSILQENIKTLNHQLTAKTTELNQCNSDLEETSAQLELKTTLATQLQAEKEQLETINNTLQNVDIPNLTNEKIALQEENAELKEELDYYKELSGSSEDYLTIIENLENTISTKETALASANSQITQLTQEKQELENQINSLNIELASVKEELSKYKVLGEIDHLQVSSYQGTWYKDGTFADYYMIDNGVAIHNANEDTGIVQCLNNQMYLFMNNNGSTPVELSADGLSFITEDGTLYTKFYINTIENIIPSLGAIAGSYVNENYTYVINSDNTLSYSDGNNIYYGAYTCISEKINVGGNICVKNYITATIDVNNVDIVKNFELVLYSNVLLDVDDNIYYSFKNSENSVLLYANKNSSNMPTNNYYEIIVRTKNYLSIEPGANVVLNHLSHHAGSATGSAYNFNGQSNTLTNSWQSVTLYNNTNDTIISNLFELRISISSPSFRLCDILSLGNSNCEIVSVKEIGTCSYSLYSKFADVINLNKEFSDVICSSISDYTNGTYSNADLSISVADDTTTITPIGSESITATACDVSATTDGYKIYHTITITYLTIEEETEVTNTLVLNLENNILVSSTLNEVAIELTKN